ncbi:MAG: hypothetical protein AAGJ54_11485, partial [Planctomycetota bacterium]
ANRMGRGVSLLSDQQGQPRLTSLIDADGGALYVLNRDGGSVVESYADPAGSGVSILSANDGSAIAAWGTRGDE